MGGYSVRIPEHSGKMHEIPCHKGGVPIREVVLRATRARIQVGRSRADLTYPASIGLWWDHRAQALKRVKDVHAAVLHAILVAGHQAAADTPTISVLALFIKVSGG